jgi:hypothetical protein
MLYKNCYYYYSICSLFVISFLFILNIPFIYGQGNISIFTPEDRPYNKTFSEWAASWWNYHLGIVDIKENASLAHPRDNYSPEKCAWNQDDGPVWFLPDGKDRSDITEPETRVCSIPEEKALLVQVIGSGCSTNAGYKTDDEIRECAIWVLPQSTYSVSIDGNEIINTIKNPTDKEKCYIDPYITNLTYTENNIYHRDAGTYHGMVAGCFLFIPPLDKGSHEVVFKESAIEFSNGLPVDKRLTHVKYILNIG